MKNTRFLLAVLALSTSLCAQDNAANPAAAAAPAAVAPAAPTPVPVDPAKLALAHEAIAALKADKMFDGIVNQVKLIAAQTTALPASATPEERQKAQELSAKLIDLSMGAAKGLISQMDQVYAEVYSTAELQAMKAFYTSPEGQSMLAKQPEIMAHLRPSVIKMQQDVSPKMQQMIEEFKADLAKAAEAKAAAEKAAADKAAADKAAADKAAAKPAIAQPATAPAPKS